MSKRKRNRRLARQKALKDPKPVVLVVTEGKATEPEYLEGFAKWARNPRVDIEVVGGAGVPKTIVEKAKELKIVAEKRARQEKDKNLAYDKVWCVFDVDDHHKIPDAKQRAKDCGLEVAISNECIELWLYLHFAEQPGEQHRDNMLKKLKEHIPAYDKHVNFSDYEAGYTDAVRRASKLDSDAKLAGAEGRNPTTGIWILTEYLRNDEMPEVD